MDRGGSNLNFGTKLVSLGRLEAELRAAKVWRKNLDLVRFFWLAEETYMSQISLFRSVLGSLDLANGDLGHLLANGDTLWDGISQNRGLGITFWIPEP